jgi:predicted GIY-YIG superfamily endonuclease
MMWVYLLRSERNPKRIYIGVTSDLEKRIDEHNTGKSTATYKFRPWVCEVKIWFKDEDRASRFETYLKSGSGRAFSNRHFWK